MQQELRISHGVPILIHVDTVLTLIATDTTQFEEMKYGT